MGHPLPRLYFGVDAASYDGKFYPRYWSGNKPQPGADRSQLAFWLNANSLTTGSTARTDIFFTGDATVSTDFAHSGTKSIKMPMVAGRHDNAINCYLDALVGYFPKKGDTVCASLRARPPVGVNWSAAPGFLKFFRFRKALAGQWDDAAFGSGANYCLLNPDGSLNDDREGFESVYTPIQINNIGAAGSGPDGGVWNTLEYCEVLDNVSVDAGGKGETSFWKNGQLVYRRTDAPTLKNATDRTTAFGFIPYWNETGPSSSFDLYLADFCIGLIAPGFRDDSAFLLPNGFGGRVIGL